MLLEASLQKSNMYKAKVIKPLSPLSSLDPDWIVRLLESSDKESEEQGVEIDWLEKLSPWVYSQVAQAHYESPEQHYPT